MSIAQTEVQLSTDYVRMLEIDEDSYSEEGRRATVIPWEDPLKHQEMMIKQTWGPWTKEVWQMR